MPVNPGIEYQKAELEAAKARTIEEKLATLRKMLQLVPKHKSSEKLVANIKGRIAKLMKLQEKQKQIAKHVSRGGLSIKKEGAARVCILGSTNSGKSTLLAKLTNAKPEISAYPFTTKKPEIGTMDYEGIKIQVVEIPALTKDFLLTEKGPLFVSVVREAELLILTYLTKEERRLISNELKAANINLSLIEYGGCVIIISYSGKSLKKSSEESTL